MKNAKGLISSQFVIFMAITFILTGVAISLQMQQQSLYNQTQNSVNNYYNKVDEMDKQVEDLQKQLSDMEYNYTY